MPRVAIVLPPREMFSPQATGAVGLLARIMARPAHGAECAVYGSPPLHPAFADVPFMPVSLPWRPFSRALRYAMGLDSELRHAAPDVIEVHDEPAIALHLARKFPKTPVVLFLHNDPQDMPAARTPAERTYLLGRLAAVAPVSNYVRDRLLDGVESRARVEVFPNFIDLGAMPAYKPQKSILFVDRTSHAKGADAFVAACGKALKMLPGWRAEIIGAEHADGSAPDSAFQQKLRADAEKAGVDMLGWRSLGQVLHAMANASMVVMPARWNEPFGLTALLAMGCGAPLLCAPRGGLAEVTGDAALPINPDDPGKIATNIVALAYDSARRAELSRAGLTRAAQFSAEDALRRLAALRARVLAEWPEH
jgi:UDP-glucose:(glucosyl)LPS alpha-1,2-glucosyltransferase